MKLRGPLGGSAATTASATAARPASLASTAAAARKLLHGAGKKPAKIRSMHQAAREAYWAQFIVDDQEFRHRHGARRQSWHRRRVVGPCRCRRRNWKLTAAQLQAVVLNLWCLQLVR